MNRNEKRASEIMELGRRISAEKQRKTAIVRRAVFSVSGLCAAAVIGLGVWNNAQLRHAVSPSPTDGYVDTATSPVSTSSVSTVRTPVTVTTSVRTSPVTAEVTSQETVPTAVPVSRVTAATTVWKAPASTVIGTTSAAVMTAVTTTEGISPVSPVIRTTSGAAPTSGTIPSVTSTVHPTTTAPAPEYPVTTDDKPLYQRFATYEYTNALDLKIVFRTDGDTVGEEEVGIKLKNVRLTAVETDENGEPVTYTAEAEKFAYGERKASEFFLIKFRGDENYYIYHI